MHWSAAVQVDPHCSYKASIGVSVTAAASRFLLLYNPQVISFDTVDMDVYYNFLHYICLLGFGVDFVYLEKHKLLSSCFQSIFFMLTFVVYLVTEKVLQKSIVSRNQWEDCSFHITKQSQTLLLRLCLSDLSSEQLAVAVLHYLICSTCNVVIITPLTLGLRYCRIFTINYLNF